MRTTPNTTFLPFVRSYWAAQGQLLGGFYPGDRDPAVAEGKLRALLDCGVTHIINLMLPTDGDHAGRPFIGYKDTFLQLATAQGREVCWMQRPIPDLGVPTVSQMIATLDAIDDAIACGGCVYMHCWGGRGRTGTVIGCWLARHGESDVLRKLHALTSHAREWFPRVPETPVQQMFVRQWRRGQ